MKLIKLFKVLLATQSIMYVLAMLIIYASSHDITDDFTGLEALIPLLAFGLLGVVNLSLLLAYVIMVMRKKLPVDLLASTLILLNVLFAFYHNSIFSYLSMAYYR